ncbi:MAG: hypothetical protein EHM61_14575 [Acidobacteria bacterium]|nr:MAG: hypothetical protein EHM61_14575 [Acidobacteriota bacterium]
MFDYLIVMTLEEGELAVEESRLLQKEAGKRKQMSLLVTNGFPTLSLVFHPHYQESFEYRIEGDDVVEGQPAIRIAFRQVTPARSTTALRLRGHDFPLELKGRAWVDPGTASVLRIESGLKKPMGDLGLEALDCAVRYGPVNFPGQPAPYWLPQEARIEARTRHQHWQNVHRFSSYKHFTVKSETEVQQ